MADLDADNDRSIIVARRVNLHELTAEDAKQSLRFVRRAARRFWEKVTCSGTVACDRFAKCDLRETWAEGVGVANESAGR